MLVEVKIEDIPGRNQRNNLSTNWVINTIQEFAESNMRAAYISDVSSYDLNTTKGIDALRSRFAPYVKKHNLAHPHNQITIMRRTNRVYMVKE